MPQVEDEKKAAEALLREREAYLRQLYTSFVPLWGKLWEEESEESKLEVQSTTPGEEASTEVGREEREQKTRGARECKDDWNSNSSDDEDGNSSGSRQQRPTMWWRGADAPHIWKGPSKPAAAVAAWGCHRAGQASGKLAPGARFVPAERALLDGLEPQAVSVGRLSREYLALLGLPHESIRDMYKKARVVLCCAVLCCAVLCCAVPCCAVLGSSCEWPCQVSRPKTWAMKLRFVYFPHKPVKASRTNTT